MQAVNLKYTLTINLLDSDSHYLTATVENRHPVPFSRINFFQQTFDNKLLIKHCKCNIESLIPLPGILRIATVLFLFLSFHLIGLHGTND